MVEPGTRTDGFGTVMDVLPTFLAIAGTQHPGTSFQGREVLPIKGKSLLPMLTGKTEEIHDGYTGWELNGHRTIREGEWKIVWDRAAGEDAKWLLFNIEEDPMEQKDLATELPDKLAQMVGLWERYEEENGVIYVYPE
jgi:arylsulfatase